MTTNKLIVFSHMEVLVKQAAVEAVKMLKHKYVTSDYNSTHVLEHFNDVVRKIVTTTDEEVKKINAETGLNFDSFSNNIIKEAKDMARTLSLEVKNGNYYRTVTSKKCHDSLNNYKSFLESTCEDMLFIAEKLQDKGMEKSK